MLRARQKIGKYRILGRIASGPLADVYRAQDTIQKIKVALKIPKADDNTGHEEFLHEVQVATKLRHPNILTVLNASYIDEHFVIAMELGDESLADRIERRTSTARALDLATQAVAALAHAHEQKFIHCDIKPGIMQTREQICAGWERDARFEPAMSARQHSSRCEPTPCNR